MICLNSAFVLCGCLSQAHLTFVVPCPLFLLPFSLINDILLFLFGGKIGVNVLRGQSSYVKDSWYKQPRWSFLIPWGDVKESNHWVFIWWMEWAICIFLHRHQATVFSVCFAMRKHLKSFLFFYQGIHCLYMPGLLIEFFIFSVVYHK